jgi:hypothetical protein
VELQKESLKEKTYKHKKLEVDEEEEVKVESLS